VQALPPSSTAELVNLWESATKNSSSPGVAILEAQLPYLGCLVSHLFDSDNAGHLAAGYFAGAFTAWVSLLVTNAHQDKPLPLRSAVVRSLSLLPGLRALVLKKHDSATIQSSVIALWLVLVTLLQDDDEINRDSTAAVVSLLAGSVSPLVSPQQDLS